MTRRARWVTGLLLAWFVLLVLLVTGTLTRQPSPAGGPPADSPLARLQELREAVDHCVQELAAEQARFQAHEQLVDSLRAQVRRLESPDRTVPAEDYDAYLEIFQAHNASVEAWHDRATALRARDQACRELVKAHNALVDSLSAGSRPSAPDGPAA